MIRSPEVPISFSRELGGPALIIAVMSSDRCSFGSDGSFISLFPCSQNKEFHLSSGNLPQDRSFLLFNFFKVIMSGKGAFVSFSKYSENRKLKYKIFNMDKTFSTKIRIIFISEM